MNAEQRSYYNTTFINILMAMALKCLVVRWYMLILQAPPGRLSTGATEFEFHFKDNIKHNLLVKFIFILPRFVTLTPQTASNAVKLNASSYL